MKTIKTMEKILLAMLLVFVLGGCGSKQTLSETLQTQSHQEVHYQAPLQAESYRWTQLSGVEVTLSEPDSQTLRFIAPVVMQEEVLLFELEAKSGENVQRLQVEVIVTPVASDTEDNTTTGGSDDNTSTGGGTDTNTSTGGDSNSTTGGSSDDDNATGGSDDSNTSSEGSDSSSTTGGGSDDDNATGGSDDSNVTDVTPPVLTLNGEAHITLEQNAVYTELGVTALDAVDGNVSVDISGTVDSSTVGHYVITYTARDHAGNETNATRSVEVVNTTPTLTSLSLESNATTVNKGETIQLSIMGTYSDHSTKAVDTNVTYLVSPVENVELNGSVLAALKDGNVTVQAKVGMVLSNTLNLNIIWTVNGHTLPPEPDKTVNDATLLGIDVNQNGVRDDVERWIYKTYDHPIERGIFMQGAKAYNKLIVNPEKAHETAKYADDAYSCGKFWRLNNKEFHKKYRFKYMNEELEKIQFNTIKRHIAYKRYNGEFSGEVFGSPEANQSKCFFDANGNLKVQP